MTIRCFKDPEIVVDYMQCALTIQSLAEAFEQFRDGES